MEFWTDEDTGIVYVSHSSLCVGDYGGAGSVGEANIRALADTEGACERFGAYYSKQLWLPDTPENREIIEALDDYPLVSDEAHAEVELEWEREAFDSCYRRDLERELPELVALILEPLNGDEWYELYRAAMEAENQYPTMEYSGAYLPIKRIADTFRELCAERAERMALEESAAAFAAAGLSFDLSDPTDSLVAADWLEENDHAALAAYLRERTAAEQPAE